MRRRIMRNCFLGLFAIVFMLFLATNIDAAFAQKPGGIALCLAACAKSDKGCQDQCVPSSTARIRSRACVEECRQQAADPDLLVKMSACIGVCLSGDAATQ